MCLSAPIEKPICTKLFKPCSNNDDLIEAAGAQLQARACGSCLLVNSQNASTLKNKKKSLACKNAQTNFFVTFEGLFP